MGQPAPLAVTVASDLALEVVLGGTFLLDDLVDPVEEMADARWL
jgi:hypothetical protein